ncbi:hypothetical protein AMELA_G00089480 [Ameiurus melas]|uniref:Uncharacterized protein n=1 Tax=Ameiurus melas TaxID=219545 RepID=A0A7J6AW84_AMEME|nr:hypothetical protein AMELA_G00089480 [Ameiurus melas]
MSRSTIVVWLLAVSYMDSRAAEPIQNMSVSTGENVILPCPCSEDTMKLVWQIGEEIVVNHCSDSHIQSHRGFSVGVPLSLVMILVILVGVIVVLHIRKHQERRPRMEVNQDPQAKLPIMDDIPCVTTNMTHFG